MKPIYTPALLNEDRGNPLIEILPPSLNDTEILDFLNVLPQPTSEERTHEAFLRRAYLSRIDAARISLPHIFRCFRAVEAALYSRFRQSNPFSRDTNYRLHHPEELRDVINRDEVVAYTPPDEVADHTGTGITILGVSGVGKTTMLNKILSYYPQTYFHREYQGRKLDLKQVVWIKVDCAEKATIKGLCAAILAKIDKALGSKPTPPERTQDLITQQIRSKIQACFLGVLVIDEIQNLRIKDSRKELLSKDQEAFLNFLLSLSNSGVKLILCGNPEIKRLFQSKFRIARRVGDDGYFEVDSIATKYWGYFVGNLWKLQWTNVHTELTQPLADKLYYLSAGITAIAVKIFKEAQKAVIGTRDERITEYLLGDVFDQICELTGDGIRVKREGRPLSSIVSYEDLFITGSENQAIQPPSGETILSRENRPARKYSQATKVKIRLGDLDCPQHFEFIDKLEALSHEDNLLSRVNDIFLIREASKQALPATALREAGVLFDGFEV